MTLSMHRFPRLLRLVHEPRVIPTGKADPETGGFLSIVLPKTIWGDPLRLTMGQATEFGKNYADIGWDPMALKLPTMAQLNVIFHSSASARLPKDDYQSCELDCTRVFRTVTQKCLSFTTGDSVLSSPNATCATVLVLS